MSYDSGPAPYDPTDFTKPPPVQPQSDELSTRDQGTAESSAQSDPTDFTQPSSAAAYDNASDTTSGTQDNRKSYSDPTDFSQPTTPTQSDAAATDQSNVTQASAPIPTNDPTDFTQPSAETTDTANRGERSASLQAPAADPTDFTQPYPSSDQVNRGERSASLQTPQFTPEESGRVANNESSLFAAQDNVTAAQNAASDRTVAQIREENRQATASFNGEASDINGRWQSYVDSVNNGQQERDPQFEASINGEWSDLQNRWDAMANRPDDFYKDRFSPDAINRDTGVRQATDTLGQVISARATDASNLSQAAGDWIGQFRDNPLYIGEDPMWGERLE